MNQKLKWISGVAGFIVFVALMTVSKEVSYVYFRALLAGVATAGLTLPLLYLLREKKTYMSRNHRRFMMLMCMMIYGLVMAFAPDLAALWMRVTAYALGAAFFSLLMWATQQQVRS